MVMKKCFLFLLLTLCLSQCSATLSKSSKTTTKSPPKESKTVTPPPSPTHSSTPSSSSTSLTSSSILKDHSTLDYSGSRHFPSAVLGYVTPWSSRGYDIAKWMAHKFDIIVPVWFQLTPHSTLGCQIEGTHDLDQGWLDDVRSNNTKVKIVPRFIVDKFDETYMRAFLTDASTQSKCLDVMVDYCRRNRFAGATFEFWSAIMSATRGQAANALIDVVVDLSERLHQHQMILVLPLPPPLMPDGTRESGILTNEHMTRLLPYCDYMSVMTYDYPGNQGRVGPVAPIRWMRHQIEHMKKVHPTAHQRILMGVNMYGQSAKGPIVAHEYLTLIRENDVEITWETESEEHVTTTKSGDESYYPSTISIAHRLQLAEELDVGIGIWEMGQGLDYFFNLL